MNYRSAATDYRQSGIALVVALVLLVIITIIGLAGVRGGLMEARMATNEELRAFTFENVQSTIDALLNNPTNTQVVGGPGRMVCTPNWPGGTPDPCTVRNATLPSAVSNNFPAGATVMANVVRLAPLLSPMPPDTGMGLSGFRAARFRVTAIHNAGTSIYGNTQIVQGTIVPVAVSLQTN